MKQHMLSGNLTGNFANSGPQQRFSHLINELIQRLAAKFPYATEQGIFAAITGNFFGITGNLIERAARDHRGGPDH
jgi:hypothetical protein